MANETKIRFGIVTTRGALAAVLRFRYKVYVEECGLEPATSHPNGMETDVWDAHSIHIAAVDSAHNVVGTIRLILDSQTGLPTLKAMGSFYEKPSDIARAAEISRLAVDRYYRQPSENAEPDPKTAAAYLFYKAPKSEYPSQRRRERFAIILGLFKMVYRVSHRIGVQEWYMMVEKSLWYFLRRYHIQIQAMGPEMEFHGPRSPYFGNVHEMETNLSRANPPLAQSFMDRLAKPLPALDGPTAPFGDADPDPLPFPIAGLTYADLLTPSTEGRPAALPLAELRSMLWPSA